MNDFARIASQFLGIAPEALRDDLSPSDIPGWDSMNYLLFIGELEKAYGISFTMDEVMQAKTLGDVRRALASRGKSV